ncbi:MAG: SigE family RNA polymerase sigma factor [Actinomycetota bacterium]
MATLDEEAFREFVATRQQSLLRTAYLLTTNWATAEDLLQTALTKTYLARHRIRDGNAVEAYARAAMVTTSMSWWRRKWHGERPTEQLPEPPPRQDEGTAYDDRDELWQHVRRLPPRQRAVLVLRFYEDLSEAETARLLGISVGTVKSQTSRSMQALRASLAAAESIEETRP